MVFQTSIPQTSGGTFEVPATLGGVTFLLGANGTGKSSLMQRLYSQNQAKAVRLTAHRQTWLNSNSYEFSPSQKTAQETNMRNQDTGDQARWRDDFAQFRAGMAIYSLLDMENVRARSIAEKVTVGDGAGAFMLSRYKSPISIINEMLLASNIPVKIAAAKSDTITAQKPGSAPYSVAELSDGERNALIIAANILTSPAGSLILVDEPERHLHRSIISPMLAQLFSSRSDCAFIVSTHSIDLPLDYELANSVLVRGARFEGGRVASWEIDLLPPGHEIDEKLRVDILGGRRKIIFVEGTPQSLDRPLYNILFPGVSLVSKESRKEVESHVSGIRESDDLHWIKAYGIVDRDQMTSSDISKAKDKGIYALSVYSVEGLYYHPTIQRLVTEPLAALSGANTAARLEAAKAAALEEIKPHVSRLAKRMTEKLVKDELLGAAPSWKNLEASAPTTITVDVPSRLKAEVERLNALLDAEDLTSIVERYPVRETGLIKTTVDNLGFKDRAHYEASVRTMVATSPEVKAVMLGFLGDLAAAIS